MDGNAVWAVVDSERASLADLLEELSDEEWERPSLCAGWRVRDVAAHLALAHTGAARGALELARAGGSMPRMIRDTAVRLAARAPREDLVARIRAMVGSRRTAPGLTPFEPLIDVLVHGQDVAVPLGRVRTMPVEAAAAAATRIWTTPWPLSITFRPRRRLRGLRLVATDTDWSAGEGEVVEGPVQALLLLLTGRTVELDRLTGPGLPRARTAV
ncbi:maleylpyruvate isomerase family mycothiol-dependent enzyme [Blastococcus sp. SYSU D00820]